MEKLTINNETIIYEDIGSGEPILFIHPPGMGRKVFYEQKPLSKHFRLIIPDLAGQGDSSYNGNSEITIKRFGDDLISLMDQLGLHQVFLFGYSAGGTIAQHLAIHFPSRIKALILSGAYPIVDNFVLKNQHRLGIFTVEKNKKFLSKVLAVSHTKDKNYRGILNEHMLKSNCEVWSKFYLESFQFNCKDEIKGLSLPVLLLYGSKADQINTYAKFYEKHIVQLQLYIIKGESHQLPTRQAEHVNQIVTGYLLNV